MARMRARGLGLCESADGGLSARRRVVITRRSSATSVGLVVEILIASPPSPDVEIHPMLGICKRNMRAGVLTDVRD